VAAVNKDPKNSDITYLPQRYKMQIEAKKKRRQLKKIGVFCLIITICAVVYLILNGMLIGSLNQTPVQLPTSPVPSSETVPMPQSGEPTTPLTWNVTVTKTPDIIIGEGVPVQSTSGIISLDAATTSLRQDYPAAAYLLISVDITDQYVNRSLYEFRIKQVNTSPDDTGFPVFIDARTGDPFTLGQERARITSDMAKTLVSNNFIAYHPEKIRVKYHNSTDSLQEWIFTLYRNNTTILTGTMDTDTGQIVSFSKTIERLGRQVNPALDISAAQRIADLFIIDRNGFPLPLNMSDARYDPLGFPDEGIAGQYVFVYNRMVQDIPTDYEGFTISVDSVTGEVTEYNRRWNSPDNAFSLATESLVTHYEATYAVLDRAQQTYPASSDGLRIISAEIRWKDQRPRGSIPRPGSIPIAWKVQFDDAIIREKQWPVPGTGWVDVQSGKILDFYYQH
jgi:hypothetical protein